MFSHKTNTTLIYIHTNDVSRCYVSGADCAVLVVFRGPLTSGIEATVISDGNTS